MTYLTDEQPPRSSKLSERPAPVASGAPISLPPTSHWKLFDALGDGVYGIDLEGRCIFANTAALSLLGYRSVDDLLGRNMHDTVHHTRPDGSAYPIAECPLIATSRTGQTVRLENELLWRRDGTSFFAEYSSFPFDVGGERAGSIVTFDDLSLRSDSRKRHALQHAVSGILEAGVEADEAQSQLVAAIGSGFGWDSGILWSLDERDVTRLRRAAVWHAADTTRGLAESSVAEFLKPGHRLAGRAWVEGVTVADAARDPSGSSSHHSADGIAFPLRSGGRIVGVLEFLARRPLVLDARTREDLVALGLQVGQFLSRRKAESDLRDSETLKAAILEAALDCVVVVDEKTHIREFNAAAERTFGRSREATLGQELGALILPADFLVGHLKKFTRFLDDSEILAVNKHVEVEAIRAGGERFPAELSVTPIKVGGEALFTAYLRDITERKQAERDVAASRDAAEEANRAKSEFIANMSHELRTPLSAIIGYSEMIQEEMEDGAEPAELAPDMHKIENNARHLLGLINDVLDLSKIESGRMEVFVEAFEVEPMVLDAASTVTALVARKGNTLTLNIAPSLGAMRTDLTKLKQVLLNLLSNAAKFTEGGTITLSAARSAGQDGPDRLAFTVADDGVGMTEDQVARLFQRYVQAEASTTSKFGGTGLGLAISRAFAVMLGGDITVKSGPGQGSAFTISLPDQVPSQPSR